MSGPAKLLKPPLCTTTRAHQFKKETTGRAASQVAAEGSRVSYREEALTE